MNERIRLGIGRYILGIPPWLLGMKKRSAAKQGKYEANKAFMSDDHRRVHHFVVRELPKAGRPLSPEGIAAALDLPLNRVRSLLHDLQEHMTFLFRNEDGHVTWAYPVTVDPTPHQLHFSTGETVHAA